MEGSRAIAVSAIEKSYWIDINAGGALAFLSRTSRRRWIRSRKAVVICLRPSPKLCRVRSP
jgi:hypothetical protein